MTRFILFSTFLTALICHHSASAQTVLNNYYGTPSYYLPPGTPNPPGQSFPSFQSPVQSFGTTRTFGGVRPIYPYTATPQTYTTTTGNVVTGYTTTSNTTGLPIPTYSQTTYTPGTTTYPTSTTTIPTAGSLLQQVYPQPAQPQQVQQTTAVTQTPVTQQAPLKITLPPLQYVAPPDVLLPGLMTIKNGKWVNSDFFYNLPYNIGLKVEVVKPEGKYLPLSEYALQQRVGYILQESNISTDVIQEPCQPPLPMLYVLVMAYPCERRCVGFILIQLIEGITPHRIDVDLNGVWQGVTWERQALIAASCDDFTREVGDTLEQYLRYFTERFKYYHPVAEMPCFDTGDDDSAW